MKTCAKCSVSKSPSGFNKNKARKDGLSGYCRECMQKIILAYKQKHREKIRKQGLEYYYANTEAFKVRKKLWRESYPEKHNAIEARRRANKLQATPPWLSSEHHAEMALCYEEAFALKLYTGQEYHVDHVVPLQGKNVCGLHVPWNLQVILARDNLSKGNKHVDD